MEKTLGRLSTQEFEELIEHTIDRRMNVWLTQLTDALLDLQNDTEEGHSKEFKPKFVASLERALKQARSGETVDLHTFREQLG